LLLAPHCKRGRSLSALDLVPETILETRRKPRTAAEMKADLAEVKKRLNIE
jgi:hypothetical protein